MGPCRVAGVAQRRMTSRDQETRLQPPECTSFRIAGVFSVNTLASLLAGYAIFGALGIALTHFRTDPYREQPAARGLGLLLLAVLAGLQLAHVAWLQHDAPLHQSGLYRLGLFAVAPCFHLFSRCVLRPLGAARLRRADLLHATPALLAPWLTPASAQTAAFLVGAAYLLWLGRDLLRLRAERSRFQAELLLLGLAFALALGVALLGVLPALLPGKLFTQLYACGIGLAFLLVQSSLSLRPQLPQEVQEVAQEMAQAQAQAQAQTSYASTTLAKVDCEAALARLHELMHDQCLYTDPALSLPGLAQHLGLSAHQLSELLNTRLGKGFARYLREQRVQAAKVMLCEQPSASVLSVGLSVGFGAQSNFYEAFREIEGSTPGQYRKLQVRSPQAG